MVASTEAIRSDKKHAARAKGLYLSNSGGYVDTLHTPRRGYDDLQTRTGRASCHIRPAGAVG